MIRSRILFIVLAGLLVLPMAAQAQTSGEQLNQLVQQLQSRPDDNGLREQIIKLASTINPPPAISEDARRSFIEGSTIAKAATDASGQAIAIASFKEALGIAPWWGDAYYNLAAAQELAGQLDNAEASLKLYILTGPSDKDSREAQDHIYALEGKKKLAAQARAVEAAPVAAVPTVPTVQQFVCHPSVGGGFGERLAFDFSSHIVSTRSLYADGRDAGSSDPPASFQEFGSRLLWSTPPPDRSVSSGWRISLDRNTGVEDRTDPIGRPQPHVMQCTSSR
jgi:tetratricopeptide (TPR) repeat protein